MKNLIFGLLTVGSLSIISCKDKCKDTNCLNGGVCDDGTCICETGFSGDDCGTANTPSKITITQIDIVDFPGLDNGSTWDVAIDTDPDIVIELVNNGSGSTVYTSASFDNMADGSQFSINGLNIEITNVTDTYTIKMWDDDLTSGDDSMGDVTFTPFNGNNFPTSITVSDASQELSYILRMSYSW